MRKTIEYEITMIDHDVDHVNWREAKKILANPPDDVVLVEKVIRYGDTDLNGEEYDELRQYVTLLDRTPEDW